MDLKELRKYCIDNHRKMWNWLAENPDKNKKDWPGWKRHNDDIFPKEEENYCFLCGYISADPDKDCYNCPIDWVVTDMCMDMYLETPYYILHSTATTLKNKAKYAEIIANLPEKDDTEEILIIEDAIRRY